MVNGHWQYPIEINCEEWFGFLYRIVENDTGREYIGKKQFKSYTKKKVKGRTNRKLIVKESNWKTYTGSSKALNSRIQEIGMSNYSFFIEALYNTRGSLFYAEVEIQIKENVLREYLEDGSTPKYYNRQIAGIKFIPPMESEIEQYTNINNYNANEEYSEHSGTMIGEKNSRYNQKDVKNGLTYEEYYGNKRATQIKEKLRQHNLGKSSPNKEINFHSEEQIEKWKNDDRRRHVGKDNGMYGRPCHYKMTAQEKQKWKDNVGASIKGIKRSDETKKRMSEARIGLKFKTIECPFCNKVGGAGNMKRYHFDYCKKNPNALPRKK